MSPASKTLQLFGSGMVTGVGLNSPASCAAIRSRIDSFSETRFLDSEGEWIIGSSVALEESPRGISKLVQMIVPAIRECLDQAGRSPSEHIPLLLCVAEQERPGRLDSIDDQLFEEIETALGLPFHPLSDVLSGGRVAGASALLQARMILSERRAPYCIIAGVDSLLSASTITAFEGRGRLLTTGNSNGFIPGEAAGAVLVGLPQPDARGLCCTGIGEGSEAATIESEEALRGDGLVEAFQNGLADAGCALQDIDFELTDANGEQYWFKEASLALNRVLRVRKERVDLWHPADCIGEVGAAVVPCVLGVADAAMRKGYAPGRGAIAHFASDGSERFALVLRGMEN